MSTERPILTRIVKEELGEEKSPMAESKLS
jgi:hypothetical protein